MELSTILLKLLLSLVIMLVISLVITHEYSPFSSYFENKFGSLDKALYVITCPIIIIFMLMGLVLVLLFLN